MKFFHEEKGTQRVTNLINSEENKIWISEIACLEFHSAIFRRFRNREINEKELQTAVSGFDEQIASFYIEPLGDAIVREAEFLLKEYGKIYGLRTLDSLHVGVYNLICDEDRFFVTSDSTLCDVLDQIGIKTINPLN